MAYKSQRIALIVIYACLAVLVPTRPAQLQQTPGLPQIPGLSQTPRLSQISGLLPQITRLFPNLGAGGLSGANGQCLSSLVGIPGCLTQVFGSLVNGQFSIIGSSCCKAISEIEGNCLSNLFPSNPIFAPLLNNSCGQPSKGNGQVSGITTSKAALPGNQDIQECWSSLLGVPGCLTDVMNSLFNGRVNFFGPACCKAITLVSDHCLPKLFPFNPTFHSTLKNICVTGSGVGGHAPSPLGVDQIAVSKLYLPVKLPFLGLSDENWEKDIAKCWSSLSSINQCVDEIFGTLSRSEFSVVGLACCKSITVISHKCWPKMFPLNPLFPSLLRSKCGQNYRVAPKPWRV
ncbi:hypothetical protein CFP56_016051 [Quercus suber]|uniref:Prolamin-like domain-containing protein n=1 Tax=Quercus suber TaxID=58331 RepID=A0AAW0KP92_QUESU